MELAIGLVFVGLGLAIALMYRLEEFIKEWRQAQLDLVELDVFTAKARVKEHEALMKQFEKQGYELAEIKSDIAEIRRDLESVRKQTLKISRQNLMDEINRGKFETRLQGEVAAAFRNYVQNRNSNIPPQKDAE